MAITQDGRLMKLATPQLADDFLLVKRLRVREGLSQLFRIELELLHEETAEGNAATPVDPQALLGQPMSLIAGNPDNVHRFFHGICVDFSQGNRNTRFSKYKAELVPAVWLLTQRSRSRIFQQRPVREILATVFEGFNVNYELQGKYEPRNYCVQYNESDWDFASRLMEEEGIFYYFRHTEDAHILVVADTPQSQRVCPTYDRLPFTTDLSTVTENWVGGVQTWRVDNRLRSGKYTLWDYNFELPTANLAAEQLSRFTIGQNQNLEIYDYPGEYAKRFDGIDPGGGERAADLQKIFEDRQRTVAIRQQEIDVAYKNIYATSGAYSLTAGHRFTLENHPNSENNGQYVIVSQQIEAVQTPGYVSDDQVSNPYVVNLVCIPHGSNAAPFRPLRQTPKPVIHGSQTAVVVGPASEEIFTDKYGRVKVQFHWDREGQKNATSSCWIRVATPWAGNRWGAVHIPRIGMEVIVNFMDGDPDQPIITGAVYNPNTMPPYELPQNKTRSTLKSSSSKGDKGFNEIRFEDKTGEEQIFIHAEKDEDIRVNHDCMETIGHDRHLTVENSQFEKINSDKHLTVAGDHNESIGSNMSLKVGMDQHEKIGKNYAIDAGMGVHIKAGVSAVIEAGVTLTIKVGGNSISLTPAGIFIQGTLVMINSGGAPGTGSGCSPASPTAPKAADDGKPGRPAAKPKLNPPPPKPKLKLKKSTVKASKRSRLAQSGIDQALIVAAAVLGAANALPFVSIAEPVPPAPGEELYGPSPATPPRTDEELFQTAEATGIPIAGPDGAIYQTSQTPEGTTIREKSKPLTEEEKKDIYFKQAEEIGEAVKGPDGTNYDIKQLPDGTQIREASRPMTKEEVDQALKDFPKSEREG